MEIRALRVCVRRINIHPQLLASAGHPVLDPTIIYEDNSAAISQVLKDRLIPQIKHLDLKATWLCQQKILGIFIQKLAPLTVSLLTLIQNQLQKSVLFLVGAKFYPPEITCFLSSINTRRVFTVVVLHHQAASCGEIITTERN